MKQRGGFWIGVAWMAVVGLMAGCSGHPDGAASASDKNAVDQDALKRAVITRIANDHHFDAADVTEFSADVTDLGPQGGNTSAAYRLTGTFSVDSATPSNVYEAATQRVNANICLVAPDRCQGAHFRHTARFDVTARVMSTLDGSVKLTVDGPVFIDEKRGAAQAADSAPQPRPVNTAVSTAGAVTHVPAGPVVQAAVVDRPAPPYPPQAIRQHHTGTVLLAVTIDGNGRLANVDIAQSSGFRELDRAAQMAPMRWTFRAATKGGVGVTSTVRVPVSFNLDTVSSAPAPAPGTNAGGQSSPVAAAGRNGPSFDCAKATTTTEQAICASPDLSALDGKLAVAYRARLAASPLEADAVRQAQRAFIRERAARCQDDARCIQGMMSSRLGELQ